MSHKLTTEEYVARCRKKFGDKFTYHGTRYVGMAVAIKAQCSIHGTFSRKAETFLKSPYGCPCCAEDTRLVAKITPTVDWIRSARSVHGYKYSYKKSKYVPHEKIQITCRKHGDFWQSTVNHLWGNGCPACADSGFKAHKPASLYLIGMSRKGKEYVGYGIANNLSSRMTTHHRVLCAEGYTYQLEGFLSFSSGRKARALENSIKETIDHPGLNVSGFKTEALPKSKVKTLLSVLRDRKHGTYSSVSGRWAL